MPRSVRRLSLRAVTPLLVGAATLAGALAIGSGTTPAGTAAESVKPAKRLTDGCRTTAVRFGIVLADDDASGRRAANAIVAEIGRQIGCRALVVTRPSQPALLAALALHQVDFAQVDPAVLAVGGRTVALTAMGAYSELADTPARVSTPPRIWARAEAGAPRDLSDARGRRIALGPALTSGGELAPRAALLAAGVATAPAIPQAGSGLAPTLHADDDAQALAWLRAGRVTLALTRGPVPASARRGLRSVWTGERPLADVLVIRPGVPNEVRRLLLSAVRNVPGTLLAPLASRQGIDQPIPLLPVPAELYDSVSDQLDALTAGGLVP